MTTFAAKNFTGTDSRHSARQPDRKSSAQRKNAPGKRGLPGQVVLVLQGGGALGAYQAGVFQAMHEAGIEPDWIVGTSIGAINAALIAGNPPDGRMAQLRRFWGSIEQHIGNELSRYLSPAIDHALANLLTVAAGIRTFFIPNPLAMFGQHAALGTGKAAYYTTEPLRRTLSELVDFGCINEGRTRISLGAVNVRSGEMTYFDSREASISMDHVMASSAYPPAFPAIGIDGDFYWDGGIYSNTPIEAVLDDNPRRDSVIFAVDVWNPEGSMPESLWQVAGRQKEILYASRTKSHLARQKQIHHLRHVIRELTKDIPEKGRRSPRVKELASWGCHTTMHVVRFVASGLRDEDHLKDIDFTPAGIDARWKAGYADAKRMIDAAPWEAVVDPTEGVVIHDMPDAVGKPVAAGIDGFEGRTK
ncbi:patatin-like phospholipase family protein [Noviherbaspirillum sp.]|uniref:patatin-like phospholipase family protein n=1 Tax=Noviherbaspirillum sp. TaxID=1926288 RepID=UPI002D2ADB0E|nr:patatin-like phospholipase family protein [Noviherbaspirillum sp.]HZW19750.1 patatin-like phospholipase family protein [Noviherbaspirillum sp.]